MLFELFQILRAAFRYRIVFAAGTKRGRTEFRRDDPFLFQTDQERIDGAFLDVLESVVLQIGYDLLAVSRLV